MCEQRKPIKGYEGKYFLTREGRVYSYIRGIYLKPQMHKKDTTPYVGLYDGKGKAKKLCITDKLIKEYYGEDATL